MKKPDERKCFVGEMLEWAASPSTKTRGDSVNAKLIDAINSDRAKLEPIHDAYWRHHDWIAEEMEFVRALPHAAKLVIGVDARIGPRIPYDGTKMLRMREASRVLGRKLHHVDFHYFTIDA